MEEKLKNELVQKMTHTINMLKKELIGLRTGRSSIHLLDQVIVDAYGKKMSLSQVGTISTPDAKTITIQVWDKQMVSSVSKAIIHANLGVNPISDGQLIRINIPPLSEERRKELVKIAYKCGESSKIILRNIRRDGMEQLKKTDKNNKISKDISHSYSEKVQKLTDEFTDKVDKLIKSKEKDILII